MTNAITPDPQKIHSMFSQIAGRYDLANTVLSGGIHHLWRKKVVKLSEVKATDMVLDCATGTGDLAIEFARKGCRVLATDFCEEMMAHGPSKSKNLNIEWEKADVLNLNYSENTFDISSIAFGIRNVPDAKRALIQLAKVTKAGGKVVVLEFGQPQSRFFAALYNFYSHNILPFIGGMVTGDRKAYSYLQKSSAQFPCGDEFLIWMRETNSFTSVSVNPLTGGIAYIYTGIVK